MLYQLGKPEHLYVLRTAPIAGVGPGGSAWAKIAGRQITWLHSYDCVDDSYLVSVVGQSISHWVYSDWIELVQPPDLLRRAWQNDQLNEAQRQIRYAAAFQRLMWREMMGMAAKKWVGETVTIKNCARTVEGAFPSVWNSEWYALCWGRSGVITGETRELGEDLELHRAYKVHVRLADSTAYEALELWFLGEDLMP